MCVDSVPILIDRWVFVKGDGIFWNEKGCYSILL